MINPNFKKFIIISLTVTALALQYVHQQIEIIKQGYSLESAKRQVDYLLDKNAGLVFGVTRLESPGDLISNFNRSEIAIRMPSIGNSESLAIARGKINQAPKKGVGGVVEKILDVVTARAEAKTGN